MKIVRYAVLRQHDIGSGHPECYIMHMADTYKAAKEWIQDGHNSWIPVMDGGSEPFEWVLGDPDMPDQIIHIEDVDIDVPDVIKEV
jgi:hypothetical protein